MAGLVFCKSSLFLPVCPHARPVGAVCSLVRLFLRSAWASAVAFLWFSLAVPSGCRLGVSRLPALTGRGRFRFTCSSFRFRLPRSGVTRTAFWSLGVVACACAGLRLILEPPSWFSLRRFGRGSLPVPGVRLLTSARLFLSVPLPAVLFLLPPSPSDLPRLCAALAFVGLRWSLSQVFQRPLSLRCCPLSLRSCPASCLPPVPSFHLYTNILFTICQ